jgi:hypothetical protein
VKAKADPQQVSGDFFDLLGKIITVFKSSKGELTVEGITAKQPDGETLVALKKVTLAGALGGLGGNAGALRLTIGHEGLTLAPSLLPAPQVPRRVVIDFGLEAIDGGVLRKIAETAAKLSPDASDDERRQTTIQILALTMSLQPVFRLYEAAVDFRDVSVEASGEAKRAPPAPIGFATTADIAVHNFDGLSADLAQRPCRGVPPQVHRRAREQRRRRFRPQISCHLGARRPLQDQRQRFQSAVCR